MVRTAIIIALIATQAIFGAPAFLLGSDGYWVRALSYSFFHAGWLHLAINCIAIWGLFAPKTKTSPSQALIAYTIAILVYPLSIRPVIGFSNILYALIGLRTPPLKNKWWRSPAVITFLVITTAMVFIPQFSATTHIAAFILGCLAAVVNRSIKNITRDARRFY